MSAPPKMFIASLTAVTTLNDMNASNNIFNEPAIASTAPWFEARPRKASPIQFNTFTITPPVHCAIGLRKSSINGLRHLSQKVPITVPTKLIAPPNALRNAGNNSLPVQLTNGRKYSFQISLKMRVSGSVNFLISSTNRLIALPIFSISNSPNNSFSFFLSLSTIFAILSPADSTMLVSQSKL